MDDCKPSDIVIFCEMCPDGERKPARKTCMKCEISMCVQHLQAHLTTPVLLQTHPLTEPMSLGGATKCPHHGKLVEYYCLDDMTCVCVSCAIEDQHRLHNMKTFSTAHKELMEKLITEQRELLFKTDDDNLSLEKWEKSEKEKLTCSGIRLIEAVSNLRDITLISVQSSVSARMVAIQTSKNSTQAAQKEKDTYRFLQMYAQVHRDVEKAKAVDLRKGLEPGTDRDKLIEELRQSGKKLLDKAVEFGGSVLMMVDPENHQKLVPSAEDLVFDPQVFSSGMALSPDKREVFYSSKISKCSATLLIQSAAKSNKVDRWVIDLPQDYDWTTGLCDKQFVKDLMNGPLYGLSSGGNQLSALSTEYVDTCNDDTSNTAQVSAKDCYRQPQKTHRVSTHPLSCQGTDGEEGTQPETVEVVWDFGASTLSFFGRTGSYQRQLLFTCGISPYHKNLIPFVKLGKENDHFTPQYEWTCSCGSRHRLQNTNKRFCQSLSSDTCSCGAIIGGICITELICKLV